MRYTHLKLQDFIAPYRLISPTKELLSSFSKAIESYRAKLEGDSSTRQEEYAKNILRDMLSNCFDYECNTKDKIDLAIYEQGWVRVIIECKATHSKEFIANEGLESKAFYQSILYYLKEHITHKNNNLTHIILTNYKAFYLIDAKAYAPLAKDKAILKAFNNHKNRKGNDSSTKYFYEELKSLLPKLDYEIPFIYFRLDSPNLAKDTSALALIYQALSPFVLLKAKTYIDANTLNIGFYNELLYILGLEEITQNGKILIQPSSTPNTLLDSLCAAFNYQKDKDFEDIFALLITWNNRLLFLRLLESMLLSFQHIQKPFLELDSIPNFITLNSLFFDILAKLESARDINIPKALSDIPYLNSSLFDKTPLEKAGKAIKLLNSEPLKLYEHSILYKRA